LEIDDKGILAIQEGVHFYGTQLIGRMREEIRRENWKFERAATFLNNVNTYILV
jgi:hypothetical protein